jgi:DNA repair exonuclease SbcCD nuclease subunit
MGISTDRKVDFTHCGGDLFEFKNPKLTEHKTIIELANIYASLNVLHFISPGNHDVTGEDMVTLNQQPLGVLLASGVLCQVQNNMFVKKFDDGTEIRVALESYPFEEEPELSEMTAKKAGADLVVLGLHVYASPRGGKLFGDTKVFSYSELSQTNHDVYLLGHYHADNGAIKNEQGQLFVNVGSVTRGDYGDENLTRRPKCCVVTVTKHEDGSISWEAEEIELKVKSPADAFDLEAKEKLKETKKQTEAYVAQLQSASVTDDPTESATERVLALTDDREIREAVLELIAEATVELQNIRRVSK